ncbi:N-formylglutamate deformylase [Maricaulis sp.]|uniref:N-formylglutamate deformylase n=1 Tax=Maricaulis sp. TaxID=1486257 RepID=UPI00262FFFCD|nr:N-formylglutamate deformylase [Maricaulis sp.]
MMVVTEHIGGGPLVVSMPHSGLKLSPGLEQRLSPEARALPDTDWHIPELYDFLAPLNATIIAAEYSRYVIDLNRDPSGQSLYPGQATTALVPVARFDGEPIYRDGEAPDTVETEARKRDYFEPYHAALERALERARSRHGYAFLWDAHSIASEVPRLFEGGLPDLNLGTNSGASCAPVIEAEAVRMMQAATDFSSVSNGRFKGGWITRHYGRPELGVHALQMEIGQNAYMGGAPGYAFDPAKAARLRPVLNSIISAALDAAAEFHAGASS